MHQTNFGRSPNKSGRRHLLGKAVAGLATGVLLASGMAVPANAALSETGPIDPSHGYPAWFTDSNGMQLELCLNGPLCLATAEKPNPSADASFPDNFPGEAFWWAGEAEIESGVTSALLVLAQEAAFGGPNHDIVDGEQTAFSRVRIRITGGLTPNANYTITHPYGTEVLAANASGVINYTSDHGCFDVPCTQASFARAAAGPIGPFLRWTGTDAPEGYVGDPNMPHTVVGSPHNTNYFRIVGPGVNLRTDLFSIQGKIADPGPFFDVPGSHPFVEAITFAKNEGITTGYPDGTFRPFGSTERGAMAAFLYRYSGITDATYTPPTTPSFTDVPTTHQFYKEIEWLKSTNITTGMTPTTFAPRQFVNRKDMAAFIYRLAGSPAYTPPATSPFADLTPASQFYKEITWLHSEGITTGYPDGYHPLENVHRQASAAFLYRLAGSPAVTTAP